MVERASKKPMTASVTPKETLFLDVSLRGGSPVPPRTKTLAFRLPIEAYSIIERRAEKQKIKTSDYLKNLVSRDALRRR